MAARSLAVQNDVSDKDRREMERTMHEQVLDVAGHAEVRFESRTVRVEPAGEGRFRVDVDGALTLRGVTRPERVSGQVFVAGETLRVQGGATLRQSDYGIAPVSVAGGALKLKDELQVRFDLLARKA
jgi:polyisoprenoid-binding protein YceI